jgi:2-dehydro-3-deoxyphosphogluconate aldolase / (4S)-4-hydroxy-2-oxoglutarate aldolase
MIAPADAQARIETERLVAILRTADLVAALRAVDVLAAEGVTVIEFSLAGAASLEALRRARERHGDALTLGAGTVVAPAQVEQSLAAGAEFLIAPNVDKRVCAEAAQAGVLHVPGAFSPTEVALATSLGAPLVKLFPAARLGPGYVRDLRGPYPDVRLLATGGVTAGNAGEFLAAGCVAVAAGGALGSGDPAAARALRDAVRGAG